MNSKLLFLNFLSFSFVFSIYADDITISNNVGVGEVYWTSDNTYHLEGGVFVDAGTTLYIEAGTVIKGMPGVGQESSYLCVARGAKLYAEGTADAPIIFTFEEDPLDGSVPLTTRGQWGGLIVLGYATLNSSPGESAVEGIPTNDPRGIYGGNNDTDNSGVITYVSIRHGGTEIGAGNEINGLTLGGVGSETSINNVEVIANMDDGIEFFGGTVSIQHAFVSACGDDSFDYDEGWRGQLNSHWVCVASSDDGDRGGEHDGGTDPETAQPYAIPFIDNAIFVGRGSDAGKRALTFRDNAGGNYTNSIFVNWAKGVDIEDLEQGEDSYSRFLSGELTFTNNIVDVTSNAFVTSQGEDLSNYFEENGNIKSSNHGITWTPNEVNMGGHANWATWTLAMTSGWVEPGFSVNIDKIISEDITIYPNPVINSLNVKFNETRTGNFQLTNSLGQVIKKGFIDGRMINITDINSKGIYILNINFENDISVSKIIYKN